jgi:TolB-like protein/cytochrome c-type biogenesis protein CcmH/NrfG
MDLLSRIAGWLGENEATISAVVGIAVLTGIVLAGLRSLVRRREDTTPEMAPSASAEPTSAAEASVPDLDPLTVPGFEGRPAIAVLPFDNLSGDPEQEYFADGIAEDLITRLSALRRFPVIARNSSFTYKGKAVDVKHVGRELGVGYVVEGSVRKGPDRVRISAQLIDTATGAHVWAETYDRELQDIFVLQDEITEAIVACIGPEVVRAEWEHAIRKEPQDLDALDLVKRALWHYSKFTKADNAKAGSLFRQAAELDPNYAAASYGIALVLYVDLMSQWADSPSRAIEELKEAARRGVALDHADSLGQIALASACVLDGKADEAEAAFERAIQLNPSFADAHYFLGLWLARWARPEEAIEKIEKAIRLNPKDPLIHFYFYGLAVAHFVAERYEDAVAWSRKSLQVRNDYYLALATLAASLAHLGRIEKAKVVGEEVLQLNPEFTLADLGRFLTGADTEFRDRYLDGLRKAGLPE